MPNYNQLIVDDLTLIKALPGARLPESFKDSVAMLYGDYQEISEEEYKNLWKILDESNPISDLFFYKGRLFTIGVTRDRYAIMPLNETHYPKYKAYYEKLERSE